jgi:hypothetical protein
MKKRIFVFITVLILLFLLTACKNNNLSENIEKSVELETTTGKIELTDDEKYYLYNFAMASVRICSLTNFQEKDYDTINEWTVIAGEITEKFPEFNIDVQTAISEINIAALDAALDIMDNMQIDDLHINAVKEIRKIYEEITGEKLPLS